jgi:hypothetical protein
MLMRSLLGHDHGVLSLSFNREVLRLSGEFFEDLVDIGGDVV